MTSRHLNQMDATDLIDRTNSMDVQLVRALASYTPADAPAGLEQRLSARLAAAVVPRPRFALWALRWGWGACALVAISLAAVVIHQHRHIRNEAKVQSTPALRPKPAEAAPIVQAVAVHLVHPARRAGALRPAHAAAPDTAYVASLSEMRAPSRPAPPAPLTAEERLLLRVVERRNPEQMAILNPQVRASKAAESDREFQSFVEGSNAGNE